MEDLKEEILQLILQYLGEVEYKETLHSLGAETKLYFDIKYFEELVVDGNWKEADKYFSSFTQNNDRHPVSLKVLDEIRKNMDLDTNERDQITTTTIPEEARVVLAAQLKDLLMSHPLMEKRMHLPPRPPIEEQKLESLIEKGLDSKDNCDEKKETDIMLKTLDEDHQCSTLDTAGTTGQTTTNNLMECDTDAAGQTSTNNLMECDKGARGQDQ